MGQVTEERMTGGIQGSFTWLEGGLYDLLCIYIYIHHDYDATKVKAIQISKINGF